MGAGERWPEAVSEDESALSVEEAVESAAAAVESEAEAAEQSEDELEAADSLEANRPNETRKLSLSRVTNCRGP